MATEGYRELLDEIASLPPRLREAAEEAGDPPEGEWGAAAILAHLAATEQFFLERINRLLTETQPHLRSFGDAADQRMDELVGNSWEENYDLFSQLRGQTVSLLLSVSLAEWERSGFHEQLGTITVADVVENIVDHDADHLAQMRELGNG